MKKNKKLWSASTGLDAFAEQFTVGSDREMDLELAEFDVLGSLAHINMLARVGLLSDSELDLLKKGLIEIYDKIKAGKFFIAEGVEDIHSQVEIILTEKLGDVGKKIHSGRSRNDQVLVDLKLFMRDRIMKLTEDIQQLFSQLLALSDRYADVGMPGYTHTQAAMPSSFGLWFGAFAESLLDDTIQLRAAYTIVNKNPLGSAAGYGSSFPLDRQLTTELLGFDDLNYNSIYAQMGRGKSERVVAQALGSFAETLGKMASDIILYLSQNFNFISFPEQLTTGSSIMPHKKNPDIFEILRAKCNQLKALPNEIMMITANLTSGYHRDLQLIKEKLIPAFATMAACMHMLQFALAHIHVNREILNDEKYLNLYSVEAVNQMVMEGVPFRDAYHQVAAQIKEGTFQKPAPRPHQHQGSMGNLCNGEISIMMDEVIHGFKFAKVREAIEVLLNLN